MHKFYFSTLRDEDAPGGGGGTGNLFSGATPPPGGATPPPPPPGTTPPPPGATPPPVAPPTAFSWATSLDERGEFKPGWTDALPDNLKGAKDTLGRYKSPEAMMLGLQSANQKLGAKSNAVIVPDDKATPEVMAEFRKALNIPDKPEGYGLKKPEQLPAGVEWSEPNAKAFAEIAHKHNMTPAAVKALTEWQIATESARQTEIASGEKAFVNQGLESLKTEWGADFQKNMAAGQAVLQHYGQRTGLKIDSPALVFPEVAKLLAAIHTDFMSEHGNIRGRNITGNDPASAAKDIRTNSDNPLYKKYQEGDPATVQHVRGLDQQATPPQ